MERLYHQQYTLKDCKNKIIAIYGHTGSGKTTFRKNLVTFFGFFAIKSLTTRLPRKPTDNEYNFVSREFFEDALKNKELINVTEYEGNYYGIPKKVLLTPLPYISVLITDASNVFKLEEFGRKNNIEIIFIYMETRSDWTVKRRLYKRKTPERADLVKKEKRHLRKYYKKQLAISYRMDAFSPYKIIDICKEKGFFEREEIENPE